LPKSARVKLVTVGVIPYQSGGHPTVFLIDYAKGAAYPCLHGVLAVLKDKPSTYCPVVDVIDRLCVAYLTGANPLGRIERCGL
jgi:hypothetical protein